MGIGFAVARFSLFLREFRQSGAGAAVHGTVQSTGLSLYAGVGLVLLGVIVNAGAVTHHVQTVRELRTGTWVAGRVSRNGIALAAVLGVVGVAMAVYLLLFR